MAIAEKIAYLSGLIDGLGYGKDAKEGKIFETIIDVLEEMADEVAAVRDNLQELEEFTDALDDDLSELEDLLDMGFDLDHDDFDDDSDDDEEEDDDEDDEDEDEDLIEINCPQCGFVNTFDPEVIWETDDTVDILCSVCQTLVFSTASLDGAGDGAEGEE